MNSIFFLLKSKINEIERQIFFNVHVLSQLKQFYGNKIFDSNWLDLLKMKMFTYLLGICVPKGVFKLFFAFFCAFWYDGIGDSKTWCAYVWKAGLFLNGVLLKNLWFIKWSTGYVERLVTWKEGRVRVTAVWVLSYYERMVWHERISLLVQLRHCCLSHILALKLVTSQNWQWCCQGMFWCFHHQADSSVK